MGFFEDWDRESTYSTASGRDLPYIVLQVTLKEKFLGTGSGNLEDLEEVINNQFRRGYRLLSMSTSNGGSKGLAGGDRIQATLVFEKMNLEAIYLQMQERSRDKGKEKQDSVPSKSTEQEEKRWICIKCNTKNPEMAKFCIKCGEVRHYEWKCTNCGVTNDASIMYCFNCGKAREEGEEILPAEKSDTDQSDRVSLADLLPDIEKCSRSKEIIELIDSTENIALSDEAKQKLFEDLNKLDHAERMYGPMKRDRLKIIEKYQS